MAKLKPWQHASVAVSTKSAKLRLLVIVLGLILLVGVGLFSLAGAITLLIFHVMMLAIYLFMASGNQ